MRRLGLLATSVLLLPACNPNYGDGGFLCTNGDCPSGYVCVAEGAAKVCRKTGTPPRDARVDGTTKPGDARLEAAVADGEVNPCLKKPDGTDCSPTGGKGFICRGEKCVASSCGDKYLDKLAGEECDDGNTTPDDGCDACKWNCKDDLGCDDKNPCNGVETCDLVAHKCKPGPAPSDGTPCTIPSTPPAPGVCNAGKCAPADCGNGIKENTEECDDNNAVDGDGCDNDCKFSCHLDSDCDDKNVCTGQEVCKKLPTLQLCSPGMPKTCDDAKPCTTDSCDPVVGCQFIPIDNDKDGHSCEQDCNDNDPTIYVGAIDCPDGKDNDCNNKVDDNPTATGKCWADPDGDGYATTGATSIIGCTCPATHTGKDPAVPGNADCKEYTKDVNPGQTSYFTSQYCVKSSLCLPPCTPGCLVWSWDYNCSGAAEKQYNGLGGTCTKCTASPIICAIVGACSGSGWTGAVVPDCGVAGTYRSCIVDKLSGNCTPFLSSRTQTCH